MKQTKSLPTVLLTAFGLLVLSTSISAKAADLKDCTLTQPPTTPVELIENIKCAISKDIFFDEDIFTNDEKLWKIFAAQQFLKDYPYTGNLKTLGISSLPIEIDRPDLEARPPHQRLSIDIRKNIDPDNMNKPTIWVRIENTLGLRLRFPDILRLFGPRWRPVQENILSSGEISSKPQLSIPDSPMTTNHSHGAVQFTLQTPPSIKAAAIARFDDDDTLVLLEIFIARK